MECKCLIEFWKVTKHARLLADPNLDKFCLDGKCKRDDRTEEG